MCDVYGEACFSLKIFTNGLNMDFSSRALIQKTVHKVETQWVSGKEKVPGAAVSQERWTNCFFNKKGTISIDFLEKGTTINSVSDYQIHLIIEWSS